MLKLCECVCVSARALYGARDQVTIYSACSIVSCKMTFHVFSSNCYRKSYSPKNIDARHVNVTSDSVLSTGGIVRKEREMESVSYYDLL